MKGGRSMESEGSTNKCSYIIDRLDRIIGVSGNWLLFAQENKAGESCHPDVIVNKSIWDFIDGVETRQLYEILLQTVRARKCALVLPFRCDAPGKRRYLELTITPVQEGQIVFSSATINEELRDTVDILEVDIPRSDQLITMCSMCKKVALSENSWVEVEAAVVSLKLFEKSRLPRISHGLCTGCFASVMSELDNFCA